MKGWKRLFDFPFREIHNEPAKVIRGSLPDNLQGTLLRNSSAFFPRINANRGHLFDGVIYNVAFIYLGWCYIKGYLPKTKTSRGVLPICLI